MKKKTLTVDPAGYIGELIDVSHPFNVRVPSHSYPLDTIKTRLHLGRALSVPSLPDMYRGLASSLVGQVPYGMLTFGTYELYKTALLRRFPVRTRRSGTDGTNSRLFYLHGAMPGDFFSRAVLLRLFAAPVLLEIISFFLRKCVTRFAEEVQNCGQYADERVAKRAVNVGYNTGFDTPLTTCCTRYVCVLMGVQR